MGKKNPLLIGICRGSLMFCNWLHAPQTGAKWMIFSCCRSIISIVFRRYSAVSTSHPVLKSIRVPTRSPCMDADGLSFAEPLNISKDGILRTVICSQAYWPYWMPWGPVEEASCCTMVLPESSVPQVDFNVAVQASLAASLAALANADLHLQQDCDPSWFGRYWPSLFWVLHQLLPCYHQLKPVFP